MGRRSGPPGAELSTGRRGTLELSGPSNKAAGGRTINGPPNIQHAGWRAGRQWMRASGPAGWLESGPPGHPVRKAGRKFWRQVLLAGTAADGGGRHGGMDLADGGLVASGPPGHAGRKFRQKIPTANKNGGFCHRRILSAEVGIRHSAGWHGGLSRAAWFWGDGCTVDFVGTAAADGGGGTAVSGPPGHSDIILAGRNPAEKSESGRLILSRIIGRIIWQIL